MSRDKFYITTAISYPNGKPHIGHAYELIATDALARFQRLDGKDVFFLTGTDEHGQKMQQTARKEGMTPRELADRNAAEFQRMADAAQRLERRLHPHHRAAPLRSPCQAIWTAMEANGDIYKGGYAGWYSVRDEAYYGEEETEVARRRRALRAAGHAGRMGRGGELFLPAVGLSGQAAGALREPARISSARPSAATRW